MAIAQGMRDLRTSTPPVFDESHSMVVHCGCPALGGALLLSFRYGFTNDSNGIEYNVTQDRRRASKQSRSCWGEEKHLAAFLCQVSAWIISACSLSVHCAQTTHFPAALLHLKFYLQWP